MLWKLSPVNTSYEGPNRYGSNRGCLFSYGANINLVVRSQSAKRAREMAAEQSASEGPEVWLDAKITKCEPLLDEGEEEIIIIDNGGG